MKKFAPALFLLFFVIPVLFAQQQPPLIVYPEMGHHYSINAAAVSPSGRYLVTGSRDSLKVWDLSAGREFMTLNGHSDDITSVAYSRDGRYIVSGSEDKTVRLWDAVTGKETRIFEIHDDIIKSVSFSNDGKWILSGSADGTAVIWDLNTGRDLRTIWVGDSGADSVALSPDGTKVAGCSPYSKKGGGIVGVWDTATGKKLFTLSEGEKPFHNVVYSPDGKYIAWSSGDSIDIWDTVRQTNLRTFTGAKFSSLAFSPNSSQIVINVEFSNEIKATMVLNVITGQTEKNFEIETILPLFTPDGRQIISIAEDVKIINVSTGQEVKSFGKNNTLRLREAAFTAGGKQFVTFNSWLDPTKDEWDIDQAKLITTTQLGSDLTNIIDYSPDGTKIASVQSFLLANSSKIDIIDPKTNQKTMTLEGHTKAVSDVAFSYDSRRIVSGAEDATLRIWDANTGQLLRTISGDNTFQALTFSPDNRHIAAASRGMIRIYNADTGQEISGFKTLPNWIYGIGYSPDGRNIIAGDSARIKVYNAANGQELRTFTGTNGTIVSLNINRRSSVILVGYMNGTLNTIDINSGRVLVNFTAYADHEWIAMTPDGNGNRSSDNADFYFNVRIGTQVVTGAEFHQALQAEMARQKAEQEAATWFLGKPIQSIEFIGLNQIKPGEMQSTLKDFIGLKFSEDVLMDLMGTIYNLEYFGQLTPEAVPTDETRSAVIIRCTVTEYPTISKIVFQGNSGLSTGKLKNAISLQKKDIVPDSKLQEAVYAIQQLYFANGYKDAKVSVDVIPDGDPEKTTNTIAFSVEEGNKVLIEEIYFEGNSSVAPSRELKKTIVSKPKAVYQKANEKDDIKGILDYYRSLGYIDVEVAEPDTRFPKDDRERQKAIITYTVKEGKKYTFTGLTFAGNREFSTETLSALISIEKGAVLNLGKLDADLAKVDDLYFEKGYMFFSRVMQPPVRDEEKNTVEYAVTIIEGNIAQVNDLIIRGNEKTKTSFIQGKIPLYKGAILTRSKMIEGLRNLNATGFFSAIIPDLQPAGEDGLVDVIYTVTEEPTVDLQFGVSFSGNNDNWKDGFMALASITDRNLFGWGNSLTFAAEANFLTLDNQKVSLSYASKIFSLSLSFSHASGWDFDVDTQKDNQQYETYPTELGITLSNSWPTPLGRFNISGGVYPGIKITDVQFNPRDTVVNQLSGLMPTSSVGLSLSLDSRDVFYDPTKGLYLSERVSFNGVLGMEVEHYIRNDAKIELFIPVLRIPVSDTFKYTVTFGLHSGISTILPQPIRDTTILGANLPMIDGMISGRGWNSEAENNRGKILFDNWAELRFPLYPGFLALDFFADAAVTKARPELLFTQFSWEDMFYSVGVGLRLTIPNIPFRFMLAKPFKIKNGEIEWQQGGLFHQEDVPDSGLVFVLSFVISQ
ncbi:hypothetical protein AGMMS49928_05670 [Spirochaetia bacterium]|nr:hypothetical protein AGMMS49928_05670 [Spirochaetia bacterium]